MKKLCYHNPMFQEWLKKNFLIIAIVIAVATVFALMNWQPARELANACRVSLQSIGVAPLAVVGAAALDAINPCEFAILILLMGSLLLNEGQRKKALRTGLSFVAAVFIAYFAMGLGILQFIRSYTLSFSGYFYNIVGGLAIILGLLNIKDYFWYGGGGFLMEVPLSWRPKMHKLIMNVTSPIGGFIIGLLISLFLLPCTSGPYVVILGMLATKATFVTALGYLIFYNLIFIAPMLAIVLAMYFGLPPEKAEAWRKAKLRLLHLIAGVVLVTLGVVILGGWI